MRPYCDMILRILEFKQNTRLAFLHEAYYGNPSCFGRLGAFQFHDGAGKVESLQGLAIP